MQRAAVAAVALGTLTLALFVTAPAAGATPERCNDQPSTEERPCVGPVTDESGGGGDTLTIIVSVVVGLAVAGVAFFYLRRQLAAPPRAPGPRPPTT